MTVSEKLALLLAQGFIVVVSPHHPGGVDVSIGSGTRDAAYTGTTDGDKYHETVSADSFEKAFDAAYNHAIAAGWLET